MYSTEIDDFSVWYTDTYIKVQRLRDQGSDTRNGFLMKICCEHIFWRVNHVSAGAHHTYAHAQMLHEMLRDMWTSRMSARVYSKRGCYFLRSQQ